MLLYVLGVLRSLKLGFLLAARERGSLLEMDSFHSWPFVKNGFYDVLTPLKI
jgi:hypothetical protein